MQERGGTETVREKQKTRCRIGMEDILWVFAEGLIFKIQAWKWKRALGPAKTEKREHQQTAEG